LLDTTTSRLEAVACRNLEKPEWQPTSRLLKNSYSRIFSTLEITVHDKVV
jgi:hypothetical protein